VCDSAGGSQTSTYDALDLMSVRQMSNSGQDPLRVTWGYSSAGDLSTITREAKVSGSWTTTGLTTQTFDDLGRRTNIRHADASNKTTGEYGYTARVWDGVADNR
jgi:outer membrane protein TolC